MGMHGTPCWYELSTTDPDGAATFYGAVLGWNVVETGMPGYDYRLASAADGSRVAGVTPLPEGADFPPNWLSYAAVDSADDTVAAASAAGATVVVEPTDIPGTGRFAIFADPQGATFGVLQPEPMDDPDAMGKGAFDAGTPGHVNWNELMSADPDAALQFYTDLFGWTPSTPMDMGEMGTYQLIAHDGADIGAIMGLGEAPTSVWLPYFVVGGAIDEGIAAVTDGGGSVHAGPIEVPGGQQVAVCQDPQGAWFAISTATAAVQPEEG